jgi:cell division protein FtsL
MTSTRTRLRRPESIVVNEINDPAERAALKRQPKQYFALNGVALVMIVAVALTIICILYLVQTARVASLGYKFSALQDDYYSLSLENSKLGYDVAREQSLDTINQIATGQLGMKPMDDFKFVQVQRPAQDNLPALPRETPPHESTWQRIMAAITGEASASVPQQPAKPATTPAATPSTAPVVPAAGAAPPTAGEVAP